MKGGRAEAAKLGRCEALKMEVGKLRGWEDEKDRRRMREEGRRTNRSDHRQGKGER